MRRWAEAKMTHQSKQVFDRQLFEERVSIRQIVGRSRVDDDELVILECEQVVGRLKHLDCIDRELNGRGRPIRVDRLDLDRQAPGRRPADVAHFPRGNGDLEAVPVTPPA